MKAVLAPQSQVGIGISPGVTIGAVIARRGKTKMRKEEEEEKAIPKREQAPKVRIPTKEAKAIPVARDNAEPLRVAVRGHPRDISSATMIS